ncbi:MAG: hypothetical protein PF904_05670 [Kiritimatiellae bacterium]|jgi:hypothetical protein|nr:hypothetical protein [Kiritimatiellia bacterium]
MKLIPILCLAISISAIAANIPTEPLAHKGDLLLADDFERTGLGDWKTIIPTFTVTNGVLKGVQIRSNHGAVCRVYRPMKNVVVEFKFKLEGSKTFNVVFDDQSYKGSHAGHICRVAFNPKKIRLGDDKEGIMRKDIFAIRKDPNRKGKAAKLLAGRNSSAPVNIDLKKWHLVTIEILGEQMRVTLDGQPTGYLKSTGIAHETKSSFHFTVNGPGVFFDDVKIWKAR